MSAIWKKWFATNSPPECPYCHPPLRLAHSRNKGSALDCRGCGSSFVRNAFGSLDAIIPSGTLKMAKSCVALHDGRMTFEDDCGEAGLLCRPCHNHQNIIIQLLSAYGDDDSDDYGGDDDSSRDDGAFQRYKMELEQRYPLCVACKARVQERLKKVEYKIRTQKLALHGKRADKKNAGPRTKFALGLGLVEWRLQLALVASDLVYSTSRLFSPATNSFRSGDVWLSFGLLTALLSFFAFSAISLRAASRTLFNVTLNILVARLCALFVCLQARELQYSFRVLLALHTLALLLLSKRQKMLQNYFFGKRCSDGSHRRKCPSPNGCRDGGDEIKFKPLPSSFSYDKLSPDSPLDTKFGDLLCDEDEESTNGRNPISRTNAHVSSAHSPASRSREQSQSACGRSSPFSLPAAFLSSSKNTPPKSKFASYRGTKLVDGSANIGIESVLEGFSIGGARIAGHSPMTSKVGTFSPSTPSASNPPNYHRSGPMEKNTMGRGGPMEKMAIDKLLMMIALLAARLAMVRIPAPIPILLVISVIFRDWKWSGFKRSTQILLNSLLILRLSSLILGRDEVGEAFDEAMIVARAFHVDLVVDCVLIVFR